MKPLNPLPGRLVLIIGLMFLPLITPFAQTSCVAPVAGLVSWWRAEGNAADATGTNTGVLQNGTAFAGGEVGQGFRLDGVDDFISVPASASLNVGINSGLTIEWWMRPDNISVQQVIAEWNNGSGGVGMHLWHSIGALGGLGSIYANLIDTSGRDHYLATAAGVLTLSNLCHVALTYDKASGVGKIFLNGTTAASANLGSFTPLTSYSLYLGARFSGQGAGANYRGLLDEVSLYNRALATNEIQAIYNAGSAGKCTAPVGPYVLNQPTNQTVTVGDSATFTVTAGGTAPLSYQWSLNGTNLAGETANSLTKANVQPGDAGSYAVMISNSVSTATSANAVLTVNPPPPCVPPPSGLVSWWRGEGDGTDEVGGNDGVLQGGMSFGTGKVGQAILFNGTDSGVAIGNGPSLNVGTGGGLTIEAWIRPASATAMMPVMEWNSGSGSSSYGVHLWTSVGGAGNLLANIVDTAGNYHGVQTVAGLLTTSAFQHVALSYDKATGQGKLYRNGQVVAQENLGVFTPQTSYNCYLGFRPAGGVTRFAGALDDVSLYARALSDAEIQAIYAAGAAGKCATPSAPLHP